MLKLLFLFCIAVIRANCDGNDGDSVYINVLIQNCLKLEKQAWDMPFGSIYQNNIGRIRSTYRQMLSDPFMVGKNSWMYESLVKRSDNFHEGSAQWRLTAAYLLGNDSESVSRADAIAHIGSVLEKDYSLYWNSTRMTFLELLQKKSAAQSCSNYENSVLPASRILFSYYNDLSLDLLQTYLLLQLSYVFLMAYNFKDHSTDSYQLRSMYKTRMALIQQNVKFAMETSRSDTWNCIHDFEYSTDTQITNFLQGYVDNEVNLSSDQSCQSSCTDYTSTKSYACNDGTYCHKMDTSSTNRSVAVCDGTIRNCKFIEGNMQICAASGNQSKTMRYTTIIFESGKRFGSEFCSNPTQIDSWIRWFVRCSNCFCLCDQIHDSERYFSLRPLLSDTKNNKVITGVAIRKINGIFQWSMTENVLLKNGEVKQEPITWKSSPGFKITDANVRNEIDYHTLTYDDRGINLDTLEVPVGSTITGIRFQMHNGNLNLEIRATEFNFNTGLLFGAHEWISNKYSHRVEIHLHQPAIPKIGSHNIAHIELVTGSKKFIKFQPTDIDKDVSQHTVPFVADSLLRNEEEAYLLSGIGVSLLNIEGTGGIIVPTMAASNYASYIEVFD